jgi:hypothetical protein
VLKNVLENSWPKEIHHGSLPAHTWRVTHLVLCSPNSYAFMDILLPEESKRKMYIHSLHCQMLVCLLAFCYTEVWGMDSCPTPWAIPPALFCDEFFWDRVLRTICLGWLWTVILLIFASWVARITGTSTLSNVYKLSGCGKTWKFHRGLNLTPAFYSRSWSSVSTLVTSSVCRPRYSAFPSWWGGDRFSWELLLHSQQFVYVYISKLQLDEDNIFFTVDSSALM